MKKTLVALAVAAVAATSANAAVVYDNDGSKVEVNGQLRVLLAREGNQRTDLTNDGSKVVFNAKQQLANGLSAFGQAEVSFGEFDDKNLTLETKKLFAGLNQDGVGALSFGKQKTNADDVALGGYPIKWTADNNLNDTAKKSVKFRSADFNGFSFGLDYLFGGSSKSVDTAKLTQAQEELVAYVKNENGQPAANLLKAKLLKANQEALDGEYGKSLKQGYGASLFYSAELGSDMNLNLAAGYGQDKMNSGKTKVNWRTAAELEFGPGAFAVNYGESKTKGKNDKTKFLTVDAKYAVTDMSTLAAQYNRSKAKGASASNGYLVSAEYKLHKNVKTFVEFGRNTTAHENKYGAGLRVFF